MNEAFGFDVYGTLVDPLGMMAPLRSLVGDLAERAAELWRDKQIEYTFRRALMQKYVNFDVCTEHALAFAAQNLKVTFREQDQSALLEKYRSLPAFPDALSGIQKLKSAGHTLAAFSNGVETSLRVLLDRCGVLQHLNAVVSVDDLKTYKPDPRVYEYLARRLGRPMQAIWLVSSNGWDVIGAKAAGLKAAWIKRKADALLDIWGIEPDLIVRSLDELSSHFVAL